MQNKTGKDLTQEAPRSPRVKIAGFNILGRTIDKCRAMLWGNIGEYHYDCPLDNQLFSFKGLTGDDLKAYINEGHSDESIGEWVKAHGNPKTDEEIAQWNVTVEAINYSDKPEKKAWLEGENKRLGLHKDATLFDFLIADDLNSFRQ